MFLSRKTAAFVAAVLVLVTTSSVAFAAKGAYKLSVPAKMIKGSAVTSGRAFYKTGVPEDSLAGIRLGREAKEILSRWGNPSRITVGSVESEGAPTSPAPDAGPAYAPSMMNPYAMAPSLGMAANMLGMQTNPTMQMPAMPGMPGLPGLPGYPTPGAPTEGQPGSGGTSAKLSDEEVTWTYDLQNGITLEFIITDGLITQITVGGRGPWGLSKTRTGLQLGDTYKLTLWVCGYPESQKYAGRFLRVSYVNKSRALFTFLNNKLVGVTIAMVPTELSL